MKRDKFIFAILAVVAAAYLFPLSHIGRVPLSTIGTVGVSAIFFFYGLKLSPEKLRSGLKNWRLHILIQSATFVLFPLVVLPFYAAAGSEHTRLLWLGFFFLAVMPSTVSSSVVMVSIAKGNIPAAIFNASISGIIGIVAAPLWLGMFIGPSDGDAGGLTDIYIRLSLEIIAPLVLGLILHRYWGNFAIRHGKWLTMFDKSIILLIIYNSFTRSFAENIFAGVDVVDLAVIGVAVVVLFYAIYLSLGRLSTLLGFSREDRITAQFCGTKKSLVHGTVFLKVIFGTSPAAGLIIIPLMVFHAVQIFIISTIAGKLADDTDEVL